MPESKPCQDTERPEEFAGDEVQDDWEEEEVKHSGELDLGSVPGNPQG